MLNVLGGPLLTWYPSVTASELPPVMLEDDPRTFPPPDPDPDSGMDATIGSGANGCVYKYSNTLAYKQRCNKRETDFIKMAGELAMPVVTLIGCVVNEQWHQTGLIMELGVPLDVETIAPENRSLVARQMAMLVEDLHYKGIIHGDIKPANMVWDTNGNLRLIDFECALMQDGTDWDKWQRSRGTRGFLAPNRATGMSRPRILDDQYALAVSLWAVFAGKLPETLMFEQNDGPTPDLSQITDPDILGPVIEILEAGGFHTAPALSHSYQKPAQPMPVSPPADFSPVSEEAVIVSPVSTDSEEETGQEHREGDMSSSISDTSDEPQEYAEIQENDDTHGYRDYPELRHLRVVNSASFMQRHYDRDFMAKEIDSSELTRARSAGAPIGLRDDEDMLGIQYIEALRMGCRSWNGT